MMTNEEAIYILKNAAWLGSNDERIKTEMAVTLAVNALEKQNPMKPEWREEAPFRSRCLVCVPHCPICGCVLVTGDCHCNCCGQHIDWSE